MEQDFYEETTATYQEDRKVEGRNMLGYIRKTLLLGAAAAACLFATPAMAGSSPGAGTGLGRWTFSHSGGTLTVVAEMDDGEVYDLVVSGQKPGSSDLPVVLVNSDGEELTIKESGSGTVLYSGFFYAEVDPKAAATCTHCVCSILDPICLFSGGSFQDCDVDGSTCYQWGCSIGGGGAGNHQIEPNFYAEF